MRHIARLLVFLCLLISAPVAVVPYQQAAPPETDSEQNRDCLHYQDRKALSPGRLPIPREEPDPNVAEGCSSDRLYALTLVQNRFEFRLSKRKAFL